MASIPVSHIPGRHCGSTGLCNLVNYHNIPWSEAMCFGIGAGLGLWYLDGPGIPASRMIHVRSADLEYQFFTRIGISFEWEQFNDPADSERVLCERLDQGAPVMLQTDIFDLPYYGSSTHFPGHVITAWGYDRENDVFFVTDTERTEVYAVPFPAMRKARYCRNGFFKVKGNMFAPRQLQMPKDMAGVLRGAIAHNSRTLTDRELDFQGIAGLEKWQAELPTWHELDDWQWTARFVYQIIEKRGTGGGGFRVIYSEFLREAAEYLPEVKSFRLPELMETAAAAWIELASALKAASEREKPDFDEVSEKLRSVRAAEAAYHERAVGI